jgi:predicted dehydrogenase
LFRVTEETTVPTPVRIGIIGTGSRGITCLGCQIAEQCRELDLTITALCNRSEGRMGVALRQLNGRAASQSVSFSPALYTDPLALIRDDNVDLILITTPTAAHREAAIPALRSGRKVYLDKPIAHTVEDAVAICRTEQETGNPMLMGFTRRYEEPWRQLHQLVTDGTIGDVKTMLMRGVLPYTHYFQTWHRSRAHSGGALNDKGSHYTDVFNWFAGSRAVQVNAFGGRNVFHPKPDAPQFCADCEDGSCPYRVWVNRPETQDQARGAVDATFADETDPMKRKDNCVFKAGADIFDHASIHYQYANGVVATLFYTIYGPRSEDEETFEVVGTKGRLILTRLRGSIDLVTDYGEQRHETIVCKAEAFETSHFGADRRLVQDLAAFARGTVPVVSGWQGMEATRMILAAMQSIDQGGVTIQLSNLPDVPN